MKLLIHTIHILRRHLRSNAWLLCELFVVFLVLWYVCDSLGCLVFQRLKPLGMDIDHVYTLSIVRTAPDRSDAPPEASQCFAILRRLQSLPEVECAALCFASLPMSGTNVHEPVYANDSVAFTLQQILVTDRYLDVFRIGQTPEGAFASMPAQGTKDLMLSVAAYDLMARYVPGFDLRTPLRRSPVDTTLLSRQHGTVGPLRTGRYESDAYNLYARMDEHLALTFWPREVFEIVFRLRPAADVPGFRQRFVDEIAPRLDQPSLQVADAIPYAAMQHSYEMRTGRLDEANSRLLVALFLLVNVFLALAGTFWYRTTRRRAELALRLSLGSTRRAVFGLLLCEALVLLALAALPAALVCLNVGLAESSIGTTQLVATWPVPFGPVRFLLGVAVTWLLMALVVVLGVWLPARRAMRLQPAEALHED